MASWRQGGLQNQIGSVWASIWTVYCRCGSDRSGPEGLGIVRAPLDTDGNSPSPFPHPLHRGKGSVTHTRVGGEGVRIPSRPPLAKQKFLLAASRLKGVLRYQSCNSSKISGLAPSQPFQDRVTRGSESGPPFNHHRLPSPLPRERVSLSTLPLKSLISKRP